MSVPAGSNLGACNIRSSLGVLNAFTLSKNWTLHIVDTGSWVAGCSRRLGRFVLEVEGGSSFDGDDLPAGHGSLIRLHGPCSIRGRDPRVVGFLTWLSGM
jgi:hypothetical protein